MPRRRRRTRKVKKVFSVSVEESEEEILSQLEEDKPPSNEELKMNSNIRRSSRISNKLKVESSSLEDLSSVQGKIKTDNIEEVKNYPELPEDSATSQAQDSETPSVSKIECQPTSFDHSTEVVNTVDFQRKKEETSESNVLTPDISFNEKSFEVGAPDNIFNNITDSVCASSEIIETENNKGLCADLDYLNENDHDICSNLNDELLPPNFETKYINPELTSNNVDNLRQICTSSETSESFEVPISLVNETMTFKIIDVRSTSGSSVQEEKDHKTSLVESTQATSISHEDTDNEVVHSPSKDKLAGKRKKCKMKTKNISSSVDTKSMDDNGNVLAMSFDCVCTLSESDAHTLKDTEAKSSETDVVDVGDVSTSKDVEKTEVISNKDHAEMKDDIILETACKVDYVDESQKEIMLDGAQKDEPADTLQDSAKTSFDSYVVPQNIGTLENSQFIGIDKKNDNLSADQAKGKDCQCELIEDTSKPSTSSITYAGEVSNTKTEEKDDGQCITVDFENVMTSSGSSSKYIDFDIADDNSKDASKDEEGIGETDINKTIINISKIDTDSSIPIDDTSKNVGKTMITGSTINKTTVDAPEDGAASKISEKEINKCSDISCSSNQEEVKRKQKRIPGRTFIIGIKSSSKGKKTMFDCVLCFDAKVQNPVTGPSINMHIKSREHTLKVMEIENICMYQLYKNDATIPTEKMITAVLNFEGMQTKQSLVLASPENYARKREAVEKQIAHLRQLNADKLKLADAVNFEASSSSPVDSSFLTSMCIHNATATTATVTTGITVTTKASSSTPSFTVCTASIFTEATSKKEVTANVEEETPVTKEETQPVIKIFQKQTMIEYHATSLEFAEKQKSRSPTKILIVTDARDVFLSTSQLGKNVKVLRRKELNFENAFQYLKNDTWYGKGTLYIFLCGVFSIVKSKPHCYCKRHACRNPVNVFYLDKDITSDYLIDNALKLHSLILESTNEDQALFCDLIPINIDTSNVAKLDKRPCFSIHPIDLHRKVPVYLTKMYMEALKTYNEFIQIHSQNLGFKFWDLLRCTFTLNSYDPNYALCRLSADGVSFEKKDYEHRQSNILKNINDLAVKIGCQNSSEIQCTAGEIIKMIHTDHDIDVDIENDPSPLSEKVEEVKVGNTLTSLLLPGRFDKVVILANSIYESTLQHFAGPQVDILVDENLMFNNIGNFIVEKSKNLSPKTLWLTLIGSFCIFEIEKYTGCLQKKCANPLHTLTPSSDVLGLASALETVNKIRKSCIILMNGIRLRLNPESTFLMLPPFPPTAYVEEKFLHSTLHSLQTGNTEIYVAPEKLVDHLDTVFTQFSKEMISLIIEELGRMNYPQKSILDYKANLSDNHMHVVHHLKELKVLPFDRWKKAMSSLISELLNAHHETTPEIPKETAQITVDSTTNNTSSVAMVSAVKFQNDNSNLTENKVNIPTVDVTVKSSQNSPDRYDHLAFIGCQEQLHQLCTTGKSNVSLWSLKFPLDWTDMKTKFASLDSISKKKKLFVILADVSLIAIEVFDSQCKVQNCKNMISYLTAGTSLLSALIEEKIDSINRLATKIKSHFAESSKVILAPLCSRYCIEKPVTADHKLHATLHDALKHESRPCILEGPKNIWENAVLEFKTMWEKEVYSELNDKEILNLFNKYKRKPQSLLEWRNPDRISLSNKSVLNSFSKLFFGELMETVLPLQKAQPQAQIKQQQQQAQPKQYKSSQIQKVPTLVKPKDTGKTKGLEWVPQAPIPQNIPQSNQYQNPQIGMVAQQSPHMGMSYVEAALAYLMPMQQPSNYMNDPYNTGMYGTSPHFQQQQQQPYMGQNVQYSQQMPYNTYEYEYQSQSQSLQTSLPYSSQITYQGSAVTYIKPQEVSQRSSQSVSVSQPERSLVSIPLTASVKPQEVKTSTKSDSVSRSSLFAEATQTFSDTLPSLFSSDEKSVGSTFQKAFIIGKKELIDPLAEMNLKNTTLISHNLSSILEKDVPFLLTKIGNIPEKSVCFLVFSLPVITKTIPLSPSCSKFGCKQSIPISSLKSEVEDLTLNPNTAIVKRIKELVAFVTKLSKFIPAIVLPLYPSRVFCDDASVISKHRISHAIANRDCYVVTGTKESWDKHLAVLTRLWNNFLKANHSKYISSDLIAKYAQVQKSTLTIKEHVNDFFTDYSEPTLWRAFLQTIMQVLMMSFDSILPSDITSTQEPKKTGPAQVKGTLKLKSDKIKPSEKSSEVNATLSEVKVSQLSENIPDEFLYNLFQTIEPTSVVKKLEDSIVVHLTSCNAILVVKKLNKLQIGDTTLKAYITGDEEKSVLPTLVQINYITSIFSQIYMKWKPRITERIQQNLNKGFNINEYKTQRCTGSCTGEVDKCMYYHNETDRRRSLNVHNYTQKMCPFPKAKRGACVNGDTCIFCHNIYEQMFYPTNFQTIICPTRDGQKCLKQPFCKFAHKNTPEMFYMSAWQDLMVYGTHNTFSFFAGAIKGICKLSKKKDVKVCLISPSEELLETAEKAIDNILKVHKLRAVLLSKKWINTEFYEVFLGTPSVLSNFHGQLLSTKTVGALIVDDINGILYNSIHREDLLKFCQKMKITSNARSVINKVFVVSDKDAKIAGVISRFLGLPQLIEVKETESIQQQPQPSANTTPPTAVTEEKPIQEKAKKSETASPQKDQNEKKIFPSSPPSDSKKLRSRSRSGSRRSRSGSQQKRSHSVSRRKRSRSGSRRKRSRSGSRRKRSHSGSRRRRSRSGSRKRRSRSGSRKRRSHSGSRKRSRSSSQKRRSHSGSRKRSRSSSRKRSRSSSRKRRSHSGSRKRSRSGSRKRRSSRSRSRKRRSSRSRSRKRRSLSGSRKRRSHSSCRKRKSSSGSRKRSPSHSRQKSRRSHSISRRKKDSPKSLSRKRSSRSSSKSRSHKRKHTPPAETKETKLPSDKKLKLTHTQIVLDLPPVTPYNPKLSASVRIPFETITQPAAHTKIQDKTAVPTKIQDKPAAPIKIQDKLAAPIKIQDKPAAPIKIQDKPAAPTKIQNIFTPKTSNVVLPSSPKVVNPSTISTQSSWRQLLGEDLFTAFVKAEKVARKTHEDEFDVFKTFPELYSDYEVYYEEFATEYFKRFGTTQGEKHKEHFWNEYWKAKFVQIKEKDWLKKGKELEKEYEGKAKRLNSLAQKKTAPVPATVESSVDKFSVEETLKLLEELSINLGMLGPAIVAIVKSARELGTTTSKALGVFTDEENLVLITMVLEKLKVFRSSAPESLVPTVTRTIEWTKQLLEYAKNPPKEKKVGLNLEAVAKASLGKDSAFILNLIKTALAYEGIPSLSKEEINNLFMKVCSMHFDMAMKE